MTAYPEALLRILFNLQAAVLVAAKDNGVVLSRAGTIELHVLPAFGARLWFDNQCCIVLACNHTREDF